MNSASNIDPQWHELIHSALPEKQKLSVDLTAAEDDRHWLTVTLTLRSCSTRKLEITLAQQTAKTLPHESNRVQCCLKVWIPWLIKLHRRIRCDYRLTLSMCDEGQPGMLSMDGTNPNELIPDLYAMQAALQMKNYGRPVSFSRFLARWQMRRSAVFWRGSTTGFQPGGLISNVQRLASNTRVKICLQQRHYSNIDMKISRVVQTDSAFTTQAKAWLKNKGILTPPVPESAFARYRYYPDLPGNAMAWGTILKYLCGCLVLRAPQERSLYYYKLMQPGKHYFPVQEDFSDMESTLEWAEMHSEQAAWIAWCGHRMAHRYLQQVGNNFCDASLAHIELL